MTIDNGDDYAADLAYLRGLGAAILEHCADRLKPPPCFSIENLIAMQLSADQYRSVYSWPTFAELWEAA